MSSKSFYDFNYLIEINEKRIEECHSAIDKVVDRFTVLIIIYSAMAIFMIPLVEKIFEAGSFLSWFCVSFFVFAIFFIASIYFTVRLIIPADVAYLSNPRKYYKVYRLIYEKQLQKEQQLIKSTVEEQLKSSYINELESLLENVKSALIKKKVFYTRALSFVLFSILPYLVSLGIHLWEKEENIQKIEIVNEKNNK